MKLAENVMNLGKNRGTRYLIKAYGTVTALLCVLHFILAVFFIDFGVINLGIYNIFSGFIYIFASWLVVKECYWLATTLTHAEICIFTVVSSIILKCDYGFLAYPVAAATMVGFNPFKRKSKIIIFPIIEICIFLAMKLYLSEADAYMSIQLPKREMIIAINYALSFSMVMICNFASETTTHMIKDYYVGTMTDNLTGFYTREYFFEKVREEIDNNPEKNYYLLCTDIADFKLYNEIYGEEMGNKVLIAQSKLIKKLNIPNIVYGRLSGDEFGILIEDKDFSEKIMGRHIKNLQEKFSDKVYRMYIYVGVYKITDKLESVPSMCEKARIAIDSIRGFYNQCFITYNEKLLSKKLNEQNIIGEFQKALDTNEFCIFLQPQMNEKNVVKGAEALVRWKNTDGSFKRPSEFIDIFERVGLITELDKFVWEQAVIELKKWKDFGREDLSISVNISIKDFYYVDIYKFFTEIVEKYKINPKNLKLEITESVMIDNIENKLEIIKNLQDYGFDIEIDDFGSGYSSLNVLKDFSADIVKIDMGFIRGDASRGERSKSILKSIIDMCVNLGMDVITEGIEDEAQLSMLSEMGCHLFQGFYFSKPISLHEFEKIYM